MTIEAALPESYHVVLIAGVSFFIDGTTRKVIEDFLRSTQDVTTIDSLLGEEITLHRDYLSVIYSCTPETRRLDAILRKRNDAESELL